MTHILPFFKKGLALAQAGPDLTGLSYPAWYRHCSLFYSPSLVSARKPLCFPPGPSYTPGSHPALISPVPCRGDTVCVRVCESVCVCARARMPWCACGDQRTALQCWFSPLTVTWVPGLNKSEPFLSEPPCQPGEILKSLHFDEEPEAGRSHMTTVPHLAIKKGQHSKASSMTGV